MSWRSPPSRGRAFRSSIHRIVEHAGAQIREAAPLATQPVVGCRSRRGRLDHRRLSRASLRGRPGKQPAQMGPGRRERVDWPIRSRCRSSQSAWAEAWAQSAYSASDPSWWAISSVNPPRRDQQLADVSSSKADRGMHLVSCGGEVPVAMDVEGAETGGADRALGGVRRDRLMPPGRPGLVVSCGTAITVERVTPQGVWQGGAIAPGSGRWPTPCISAPPRSP